MGVLRLALSLMILIGHAKPHSWPSHILPYISGYEYHGAIKVHVFFMLSGFFMHMVCERYFFPMQLKYAPRFYYSRLLRLYPTYLLIWCLTLLFLWFEPNFFPLEMFYSTGRGASEYFFYNAIGFTPNVFTNYKTPELWQEFVLHLNWAIAVEYGLLLLVPLCMLRKSIFWGMFVISAGLAFYLYQQGVYRGNYYASLIYFMTGMVLYKIYNHWFAGPVRKKDRVLGYALVILIIAANLNFGLLILNLGHQAAYWLMILSSAVSIPLIFRGTRGLRWDRYLGELSYPIYLSHALVLMVLYKTIIPVMHIGYYTIVICLAFAVFVQEWIDKPLACYRQRLYTRRVL